ncbi:tagaturonate reductase [Megamonas hypermegale]|uniref:tagaturonate reductase n=1 Tax=Megamonas hypermegale TaxID=158847 RepID=UPI0026E95B63|nr:tagaturonate reductase [Megamonas hypermegale]
MKQLNLQSFPELKNNRPEKIIQFGEGNFIRAFMDWMVQQMNKQGTFNGSVVAVQPTPRGRVVGKLNAQDGLFTVILRGIQDGQTVNSSEIINCVSRGINPYTNWNDVLKCAENPDMEFVFSNTTEAGLTYNPDDRADMQPPLSYPAKLTLFLYHRYEYFYGAPDKGMYIIPCELLEDNGNLLRNILLRYCDDWKLPEEFKTWLTKCNKFYNSLVDRVVSGYPKDEIETITAELGYEDTLIACGEPFHFLALEGDESLSEKLPFIKSGLNVVIEKDITKYRQRKVRLLNGGHTANVPASFLAGLDTVAEMMNDEITGRFARQTIKNIILPSVSMDKQMLEDFAAAVIERFQNPFIKHQLLSILLNCTSKFKVRVLPSLLEYQEKFGTFPQNLCFSFAAYIYLYKSNERNGQPFEFTDDTAALDKLHAAWKLYDNSLTGANSVAERILGDSDLWDKDLTVYPELVRDVGKYLYEIDIKGTKKIMQSLLMDED